MRPIWVHVDRETHQRVLEASKRKNIGMSTYIRELLQKDLGINGKVLRRPFLGKNVRHIGSKETKELHN